MSELATAIIVGLFCLVFGSFASVLGVRVPAGESLGGRSRCRSCGSQLKARENIPVLSYLLSRGRCRHCGVGYGLHYLVAEVGALVFGMIAWLRVDLLILRFAWFCLAVLGSALIVSDLTLRRLPNLLVLAAFAIGLASAVVDSIASGAVTGLFRGIAGAAALFFIYLVLHLLSRGGMGAGDVKLAGVLGLFLGQLSWLHLYWGSAIAFLLGGTAALLVLATGRGTRKSAIPFGPFMVTGAFAALLIS